MSMTYAAFLESITVAEAPPSSLSTDLKALWADRHGDWHQAHELCQQADAIAGDRIHAYLHRKEGDAGNAAYWYHRSGEDMPQISLEEEWEQLVRRLLS